jgi:hypothetical protein
MPQNSGGLRTLALFIFNVDLHKKTQIMRKKVTVEHKLHSILFASSHLSRTIFFSQSGIKLIKYGTVCVRKGIYLGVSMVLCPEMIHISEGAKMSGRLPCTGGVTHLPLPTGRYSFPKLFPLPKRTKA